MKKIRTVISWSLLVLVLALAAAVRWYKIESLPPAPYWEEVALGYDAYSLALTGKDHHGQSWPIEAFESFGDWKPSGYYYALLPLIKWFGLSLWVVRLPSVLAGIGIVWLVGQLAELLFLTTEKKSTKLLAKARNIKLLAMFVTAISPWAIQFSRAAWEVNLATFLITLGVYYCLKIFREIDKTKNGVLGNLYYLFGLLPVVLAVVGSMYTYHAARVVGPLLGIGLVVLWFSVESKKIKFKKINFPNIIVGILRKRWLVVCIMGLLTIGLSWPLLSSIKDTKITQRFAETSIFSDLSLIEESNRLISQAGNTRWAKLIYHRYLVIGQKVIENYASHFNLDFLFISGDVNPRHSVQYFGQLYHIELIFLLIGIYWSIKKRNKYFLFLGWWLMIGILPAALTKTVPHALRILLVMPVFMLLITGGIWQFVSVLTAWFKNQLKLKSKIVARLRAGLWLLVFILYAVEFLFFWRYYAQVYPKLHSGEWQYGYQQMVNQVSLLQDQYPDLPVYMTRKYGRPAMYYWFYTQTDPQKVQAADIISKQDGGEFVEFENMKFVRSLSEVVELPAIVAASEIEFARWISLNPEVQLLQTAEVRDLGNNIIWKVALIE